MTTETLLERVQELYEQEHYAAALRLAQKGSAQALTETGEPSRLYAEALQNEAECLWANDRWEEGMACSEKAMVWAGVEGHGQNELAARCLYLQACMRRAAGQAKEAKNLFIQAGNVLYRTARPDDDRLVRLIREASEPLIPVETQAAANATGKRASGWACRWYPDSSVAVLLTALAESYAEDDRWVEAMTIRSFILQSCRACWGSCHPEVLAQIDAIAHMAERNDYVPFAEACRRKALKIIAATEGRHSDAYAKSVSDLLDFYRKHDMKQKALALYQWKMRHYERKEDTVSNEFLRLLYDTASLYHDLDEPKKALDLLRKGDHIHRLQKNTEDYLYPDQALFRMRIGMVYDDLGQRKRALRMLQNATECLGDNCDISTAPQVYEQLASVQINVKQTSPALLALKKALRIWKELEDPDAVCRVENNQAVYMALDDRYEEAQKAINRARRQISKFADYESYNTDQAIVMINAGVIYRQIGKYDAACRMLDEAIKLSSEEDTSEEVDRVALQLNRAETLFLAGKKEKALSDYEAARVASLAEDGSETAESKDIARIINLIRRDRYRPACDSYTLFTLEPEPSLERSWS